MAGFATYSTTANLNVSVGGIDIDEGCAAANVNNAIRHILKEGKELSDIVAAINVSTLMPKAGGAFTGSITRSGAGAFPYWASSSLTSGAMYVQAVATALPSPAEGVIVFQY